MRSGLSFTAAKPQQHQIVKTHQFDYCGISTTLIASIHTTSVVHSTCHTFLPHFLLSAVILHMSMSQKIGCAATAMWMLKNIPSFQISSRTLLVSREEYRDNCACSIRIPCFKVCHLRIMFMTSFELYDISTYRLLCLMCYSAVFICSDINAWTFPSSFSHHVCRFTCCLERLMVLVVYAVQSIITYCNDVLLCLTSFSRDQFNVFEAHFLYGLLLNALLPLSAKIVSCDARAIHVSLITAERGCGLSSYRL